MANINDYMNEEDGYLEADAAEAYAAEVAKEVVSAYDAQTIGTLETTATKGSTMTDLEIAAQKVIAETKLSSLNVGGEILLENIETIADKLVMSNLSWWQKLKISKANKEFAVTIAIYGIVHAVKSGAFGLTKYRINHATLDMITLAANARMLKYVVKAVGVDTNVAAMFLDAPTVETV